MERELYKTIGQRIRQARERLGMSQEEIAGRMEYKSAATVSHFETGFRKISVADLQKLSGILGLSVEDLLGDASREITAETQQVMLRANVVMPTARKAVEEFLAFTQMHTKAPIELPAGIEKERPGKAAQQVLSMTDCHMPPVSPWLIAQRLNVPVFDWDFTDDISGMFITNSKGVCIGVNRDHPAVRRAFTVAHELGHLVYHRTNALLIDFAEIEIVATEDDETRQRETRANQFAADLLMPKLWIEQDYSSPDQLQILARKYGVSEQAFWYRLVNLRLVSS